VDIDMFLLSFVDFLLLFWAIETRRGKMVKGGLKVGYPGFLGF
jgi:hypothetical protein